ncbi:MAG: hypothetical protein EXQ58_10850 [Acidobacteria bacterium]|nr:hypothetical protein [Acidobacteriota bacterium]
MDFTPTGTDFALLFVFLFLFAWSGWLTASLVPGRTTLSPSDPASVPFSCLEWIFCCLLGAFAVTSVILLFTAQLGISRIRFWLLLLAVFDLAVFLVWFSRWRKRAPTLQPPCCRFERKDLWLLPLVAFAFWMMNRPAEFVATYRDPGEYVNIAVKLSDSPSLRIQDPQFQNFNTPEKQALFLREPLEKAPFPEVLPGFYLADAQKGELLPQFFHLYPLWLALCFKLWRFDGIFLFNVLLGTFSVCLVVGLAEQLFSSRFLGWAAGILLASNAGQIWMSRSPFSEILAQVFLLGGLTLLASGMRTKNKGLMALAGCLFGLSLFVRIDSVLIVAGLGVLWFGSVPHRRWLFLPLIGFAAWSVFHVWLFSFPYFFHVLRTVQHASPGWAVTALFAGGSILLGRRLRSSSARTAARAMPAEIAAPATPRLFPAAAKVLFGLVVLYGVFVRPHLESALQVVPMPMPHSGTVPLHNEINWISLSWYLTPIGLGLACLGVLRMIPLLVTGDSRVLWPFATIFGVFASFYLYKSQAFPDNYWVVRRYIEIVIPGCLIFACFALQWLSQRSFRAVPPRSGLVLSVLLYLMVWGGEIRSFSGLLKERELSGTLQQFEVLAGLNRDADILLLEQGVLQAFFSAPLKFIFQKTVYPLAHMELDGVALATLVENWRQQGKRVHLLSFDEQTQVRGRRLQFLPRQRFEFKTRVVEPVYERLPRMMMDLNFGVQIYEIQPIAPAPPPPAATLNMDFNFGFPTRGFHAVETTADGVAFRWTSGPASLQLPELTAANEGVLSLSLAQDLAPGLASAARIHFNGHLVAERRLPRRFEVIRWPIPEAWLNLNGKNTISFDSAIHSPSEDGLSDDRRQLGLVVDGVKLETLTPISATHLFLLNVGSEQDTLDADLSGFFSRDRDSYRWTEAQAEVKLTAPLNTTGPLRLVVRAVKSCPHASFRQWLSVSVDGRAAGRTELLGTGWEFREYAFTLPPGASSQQPVIQIAVQPAWNPAKAGGSADSRTLGCAIDWIRIE